MLNSLLTSLNEIIGSDDSDANKLMKIETLVHFTQNVSTTSFKSPTPPTPPTSPVPRTPTKSVPINKEGVIFGVENIN